MVRTTYPVFANSSKYPKRKTYRLYTVTLLMPVLQHHCDIFRMLGGRGKISHGHLQEMPTIAQKPGISGGYITCGFT
jgi:hypothetical protein